MTFHLLSAVIGATLTLLVIGAVMWLRSMAEGVDDFVGENVE
ncbi:MAG: hypothetical protein V4696_07575 [Pseudomonadota bacterium]